MTRTEKTTGIVLSFDGTRIFNRDRIRDVVKSMPVSGADVTIKVDGGEPGQPRFGEIVRIATAEIQARGGRVVSSVGAAVGAHPAQ